MERDNKQAQERQGEDYGGPADYDNGGSINMNDQGQKSDGNKSQSQHSGGTAGTRQGSSEGEQFGDFDHTGTGVDLTIEMENTDARTGLVKGGEKNADDVAGPGQYGGKAGGLSDNN